MPTAGTDLDGSVMGLDAVEQRDTGRHSPAGQIAADM